MSKSIAKEAAKDAEKWLAAEMAYGEGAGTRRKLTWAEIQGKGMDHDGYIDAFEAAYAKLDLTKFAEAAVKERKAMDRAAAVGKNFRAVKSGNLNNLSTGVFIIVGTAIVLHKTGYDKVLEEKARAAYKKAKTEYRVWNLRRQGKNVERIFA